MVVVSTRANRVGTLALRCCCLLAMQVSVVRASPTQSPAVSHAKSAPVDALILPTRLRDRAEIPVSLRRLAATLDALLTDTAQDLGLSVDLTERPTLVQQGHQEHELHKLAEATGKMVVLPELRQVDGEIID